MGYASEKDATIQNMRVWYALTFRSCLLIKRPIEAQNETDVVLIKDRYILIDCGKSFLQSAIAHFRKNEIPRIDAVILTHGHADACFGLDDLRSLSSLLKEDSSIPIFLRPEDYRIVTSSFAYLIQSANHGRFVSKLNFHVFDPKTEPSINICGLEFTLLPVEHGPGYTSLGYAFGNVIYISDLNQIYEETRQIIDKKFKIGSQIARNTALRQNNSTSDQQFDLAEYEKDTRIPMDLLILDALLPEVPYPSHFSLKQAIDEFIRYKPSLGLTVGMSCKMNHTRDNQTLQQYEESHGVVLQLAFDGQIVPIKTAF